MSRQHVRSRRRRTGRGRVVPAVLGMMVALGVTVVGAMPASAATASGPDGQTLTASKVDGLNPDGDTITLHGEGYDLGKGIYVVVCVNNGAGQQPTPCLGGADMEGGGGSSAWISSNPPSYGEGLAQPFTEAGGTGSFDVQLSVRASDEFTNCLDASTAPNGCVVGTRADHTRTADRSADVLMPITFAAAGGGGAGENTPTPTGTATPAATAGGTNDKGLARTGSSTGPVVLAALALVGAGTTLIVRRRLAVSPSATDA